MTYPDLEAAGSVAHFFKDRFAKMTYPDLEAAGSVADFP